MFQRNKNKKPKAPKIKFPGWCRKKSKKILKERLDEFNKGKLLQVDNEKDNKQYFKSLEKNDG